jgi:uncharacterized phage protein (TIGR01671 family)
MREILFRGKSVCDNGRWLYGALHNDTHEIQIQPNFDEPMNTTRNRLADLVWPESVGQYTGIDDMNCKKIFEGDIVKCNGIDCVVRYVEDQFVLTFGTCNFLELFDKRFDTEIIGNIHDK